MKKASEHIAHPALSAGKVDVALAGCGGTGSMLLVRLSRLAVTLRALGHPGLNVDVFDFDTVSESNIGRQAFGPADLGRNKAVTLTTRVNSALGVGFDAHPERFNARNTHFAIVISCVDSRAARREIVNANQGNTTCYHLDAGNGRDFGQVVLGDGRGLAWPMTRFPELFDAKIDDP
ncbi:MAG: PRTRC system ThiF family protein, partial [Victivallaceae bacterium]|nr:PRTRC system ThiF family protein [Victivallaceae bacterium]